MSIEMKEYSLSRHSLSNENKTMIEKCDQIINDAESLCKRALEILLKEWHTHNGCRIGNIELAKDEARPIFEAADKQVGQAKQELANKVTILNTVMAVTHADMKTLEEPQEFISPIKKVIFAAIKVDRAAVKFLRTLGQNDLSTIKEPTDEINQALRSCEDSE